MSKYKSPKIGQKKIICVGLPNTGTFPWQTVAALLSFQMPVGYKLNFNIFSNCLIYDAREKLAEYALKIGATHLFFLDSDMIPPANIITSLFSHDKDIISAKIFQRKYPFQPCFYTKARMGGADLKPIMEGPMEPEKWPKSGAYDFEGVGMAACLINTNVFRGMTAPYFYPMPGMGEDLTFCMKARKAGFKIYVDMAIDAAHIANVPIDTQSFISAFKEWESNPENQGKLIFGNDEKKLKRTEEAKK